MSPNSLRVHEDSTAVLKLDLKGEQEFELQQALVKFWVHSNSLSAHTM